MNHLPLRIGAVSYLNTKPLVYQLEQRLEQMLPKASLIFDLPSRLADRLHNRALDIALIPAVEYLGRSSDYRIVSDACIACRGPVHSVRLLSRVPVSKIRTLACDAGSRTSIALTRILLAEQFGVTPHCVELPVHTPVDEVVADALVIIGDRAMHSIPGFHENWDLGERWYQWTHLPFVFALWVAHKDVAHKDVAYKDVADKNNADKGVTENILAQVLSAARNDGLENLESIAAQHAPEYGLSRDDCETYFSQQLRFVLDKESLDGLARFDGYCRKHALLNEPLELV